MSANLGLFWEPGVHWPRYSISSYCHPAIWILFQRFVIKQEVFIPDWYLSGRSSTQRKII